MNYSTEVEWDADIVDVHFTDIDNPLVKGLARDGVKITAGIPTATVGVWMPGAIVQNAFDGSVWQMSGTTAAPAWYLI